MNVIIYTVRGEDTINSRVLPYNFAMYFIPTQLIIDEKEFTSELILYCNENNLDLTIFEEGMTPIVQIEGIKYICKLGAPLNILNKVFKVPIMQRSPLNFAGVDWVYLYLINNFE